MIRINLLPYREEKRKGKRQRFYVMAVLVALVASFSVFAVYTVIDERILVQEDRNTFLKQEIAKLDKQIEEVKQIREQAQALLARKQIIEALQRDRAEAVLMLSELTRQMPDGVYIYSLKQSGQSLSMNGYAQSNARVSTLMRNIEASRWLERPVLMEIKAVTVDKKRLNEFSMRAGMKRTSNEQQEAKK